MKKERGTMRPGELSLRIHCSSLTDIGGLLSPLQGASKQTKKSIPPTFPYNQRHKSLVHNNAAYYYHTLLIITFSDPSLMSFSVTKAISADVRRGIFERIVFECSNASQNVDISKIIKQFLNAIIIGCTSEIYYIFPCESKITYK